MRKISLESYIHTLQRDFLEGIEFLFRILQLGKYLCQLIALLNLKNKVLCLKISLILF